MANGNRICPQCHTEHKSGWQNDGSLLILTGVGIIVWRVTYGSWLDILIDGLLFALPCAVFGLEQRKATRLCPKCWASRGKT